ncbi:MAG: ORF6N domain-containing protein [Cytophagales bacterium]|nr:ORF6N domain-containing protein [Cytophagales bacterium]
MKVTKKLDKSVLYVDLIYEIRRIKVMLDRDLAELYGVETKNLNKAVKRNINRFPDDFMFQLSNEEFENLKFQFGTSRWGGTRKLPYVFTEYGVAMLSSVLNSEQAIKVNIAIMRTFGKIREFALTNKELFLKIRELEIRYDGQFKEVFEVLNKLIIEKSKPRKQIGFKIGK